jgi:hypothetical protein
MKLKHIALVLPMLGLSAVAFAGAPGNNMVIPSGINLIAPDSTGTWMFGIEALYMQNNENYQYAPPDGISPTGIVHTQSVGNDWNWGVEADIGYMFAGSSRDVNLSYTHLGFEDSDSVTLPEIPPIFGVGSASGKIDQDLNAASLTFGQLFTVGQRVTLHPFGGVQFADIDSDFTSTFSFPFTIGDTDTTLSSTSKLHSDFVGAGPRAGIDGAVHLGGGFSVVGTFAGALLVGNMDAKNTVTASVLGLTAQQVFNPDSYTAVVPELDAKLGLDYLFAFNPTVSMNAQIGYEAVNYFNAVVADVNDIQQINSINNTNDFNYHGPYFRLQLNVA